MAYNISLNNITTTTAPVQQELSGISLQTSASALPRVDIQPNVNEHQLPQALSPSDSCLENEESSSQQPEVKKEQAEKKKKVHKKSNKYSNHTKAKGHLAAIAGATTLGAVLAPFTGGLSLLPTAFVVLFGNASALAMYGGSEFVLGQKGPNNQIDDKKDPEANKQPEENKQPEISVPVSPRPIRAQEFRGLDEVNGRREPEPEEKGSRGKGDTFNYSPVFNFNFGDLNFNQFNTQNNTQFNTQNNTDKTNQADTDSSPTLIEQTIEKFGGNPVINVEEITKDVLIRELREQEPLIGPESKVDEMIDALVSFHEQTNEAKLIQVSFESGHKAYIGGIPDTDEQKQTDPIKAEVCVEKAKKQWPEVKPAHRLITTSGNAKIDGNPGYRNARVDVDGQTVGYTRNERGGSQPQSSGVHTLQGSQQPSVEPSPVDPGHGASGAASAQPGGEAKGAQTPSLHTQGEPISTATQTGGAQGTQGGEDDGRPQVAQGHNPQGEPASLAKAGTPVDPGHGASDVASAQPGGEAKGTETPSLQTEGESISTSMPTGEEQGVQTGGVKKWPEVAAPQRVITSAGNAKIDGNPGYRNARVDVDGQTVGYTRNERGGSQPQSSGVHTLQGSQQPSVEPSPVDPGHGASGAASAQPGGEAKGAQTPSLHTQGEPISTSMPTGEEQGVQTGGVKKWPEVAAPQRVITSAGNAKIDGNPGYRNARVDVDGQTVGYTRNERSGSQPQSSGVHTLQGSQQPSVEPSPVDPGHGASGAASAQPGGEAKGAQTPGLHTQGEPISTATQTGGAQGTQGGEDDGRPQVAQGHNPQGEPASLAKAGTPVDPGHGASDVASAQPGGEAKGTQTPSLQTEGESISTSMPTGEEQGVQTGGVKKWPEVAAPQRVITSAGNAKIDGNPGYRNARVDVDGQTVGYTRNERGGSQPQSSGVHTSQGSQQPGVEPSPVDPGHGASGAASVQPGGEAKGAQTPSLHTQGEPISTATQTGEAQGTQGGEDDGRPQVAQGHNPQGEPASLAKAGTPVDPGHGASGAASAQPGGEAKGAQTPSLHTQGEPISTATQTGGAQGTQGGEDDGRPQVAQGHNPQGEPASLAKAGTPVDPGHGASDVASAQPGGEAKGAQTPSLHTQGEPISTATQTGGAQGTQGGEDDGRPQVAQGHNPQGEPASLAKAGTPVDPGHGASGAASAQPGGEAKGAQTPGLHTQGEPISTATQTGGAQGTQGGEDDGRPQVAQGHNPQGEPASLAKAGTPVDPGHGASDVASAQPGGEAKGTQTPSLQTEGESISTSMPTGEEQGVQTGGVKKWPEVAAPQRVITSAGNAKIDGNPGYRNARVDVDGQTVGYTRNERGGSQPQSSGVHTSQGSQQPGVEPSPVDPGHGASGAASVQPGGEAKGAQTPSLHTQGEPISTATQTGGAQGTQGGEDDGRPQVAQGHNPQGEPASLAKAGTPVDPGHGASGAASAQPGGEAKGAQTPGLHTQGEPISTATQTGGAQGTQGGEDDGRPQVAQGHNPQGEPASLAKAGTPVDPGHGASDVASAQPGGEAKGTQTPSLQTEGESISTSMPTGEEQGVQTGGVKKWPEVAAPQRVITSAGNAKIDGNPGYRNARVDVDGQTVGYTRNERGGSQPQSSGVHTSQGSQQPGVEPSPVDPGHGASGAASVQPGGEAKGAQTPSLHTQGEPISTATQTGGAQGTQGGEDDGRPQVAQGHNPQGEPASLAKAGTPVEPGHGASDVASAQSGGEAKGAQTPSLHTQGEPISTATQTGGAQGTQGGEDDGRPQVAQGHNPQGEPASLAKAGTPVDPGHGASGAASAQPGGEAKGAQTPGLHTQGEPISTATQTGGAQGTQGGEDDGRPQVAQGHNPQGEPASLAKAGTPVDPGHGASDVASAQPGGEAKGTQTPSLQTEGESISTSMPTGEEQGVQTGGVKKWPEVAAPQRVITSAGNAKIDGNPGYRNARVDVDGQTVGYTRNERGGSQPQSSGVHTSQGSQQPGVEPSPVDPGHGASGAASVQPGGEAKGAQTPSLHTQGEPISTATQTGGAQNIQSVTLARADLQQTNVERGRITDVTKLVDVQALASTVAANKSEPERFVSKLHITLKGNSSADSKVGTNQPESLQAWSSNMLSHGPGVKLAQKSLVQNEIELMPQANNGETVKKIEVVSNISGKKWTVSMPAPVLTTQGMASGRGKNYTQGLFHNIRDINQTKRNIELNSTLMESTPKSDVSFVNMGDKVIPIKPAIISNLKLVS
ncbi:hypothetical protein [Vibrio parahaemolyticus]|uniref:hypothetical protein n=39 Tax=Vibrio parahaemolyticus TaxID=670 RepID=UPI00038E27BD|nr:hypothetical protein [Vibrio parahaemolyticus]EQM11297.1 hypothetical protein D045_1862 [Vibrio parahaemolyticus VP-NY4]